MSAPFMIKCNCTGPRYLYWSGTAWVSKIVHASQYETRALAEKEMKSLHPPRIRDTKDRGIEAFTMDFSQEG